MALGAASLRPADVTSALSTTLTALAVAGGAPPYRVGGTSAALLQGVHLPVGDIDLLVSRRADVDTFAKALSSHPCLHPPAWIPASSQYFTRYEVHGVQVEISTVEQETDSDAMECIGTGPWHHHVLVACGPHQVPVVRLELRLATELLRNRPDRYEPLLHHLSTHGYNAALLHKALTAHTLPPHHHHLIKTRLTQPPSPPNDGTSSP
jgi:hypothetical protein